MNKLFIPLICLVTLFGNAKYYGSTTAPVTLAGAIIKSEHAEVIKKYSRKDCPVCKGKGWYMSGDGILKIECTYCEPDKGTMISNRSAPVCTDNQCPPSYRIKR